MADTRIALQRGDDDVIRTAAAVDRLDDVNPLTFDDLSLSAHGGSLWLGLQGVPPGSASTHHGVEPAGATSHPPAASAVAIASGDTADELTAAFTGYASGSIGEAWHSRGTLVVATSSNTAHHELVGMTGLAIAEARPDPVTADEILHATGPAFASHNDDRVGVTVEATRDAAKEPSVTATDITAPGETTGTVVLDATAYFDAWKFTNDLPIAARLEADNPGTYVLQMKQSEQWLGLRDESGAPLLTTIWGYGLPGQTATYPGPTIVAYEGQPIQVNWKNMLPVDGHLLPIDTSILHAGPVRMTLEEGYVPTVVHLHGGHTASGSDGLPEAWFTQHNAEVGPGYMQRILDYENDQQAATLWYHDHALGITRLNVYSGLAGFYLLRDDNEQMLIDDGVLPGGRYEIEMAVQDRAFTADGQLYLPAYADDPIPGTTDTLKDTMPEDPDDPDPGFSHYPTAVPEFFGDFILVNGMAWPQLEVDGGEYRFRMLDGSDSRFYLLQLDDPDVKVTLVGSDGGLLPAAITVMDGDGLQEQGEQLVIAPGDRLDLVFDFGNLAAGDKVTLLNVGPAYEPFKGLDESGSPAGDVELAAGTPVGEIMQFVVGTGEGIDASVEHGMMLNPNYVPPTMEDVDNTRMLGLFEGTDAYGRILPQLGVAENTVDEHGDAVAFGPLGFDDPITERPVLGDIELWQIFNFTADAHPIHLHLVQFDILERYTISFDDADEDGLPDDVTGDGEITIGKMSEQGPLHHDDVLIDDEQAISLFPTDMGAQDTSWVGPGEMIGIAANFDIAGEYVWHCHILSHEDHDMMRPYEVIDKAPVG